MLNASPSDETHKSFLNEILIDPALQIRCQNIPGGTVLYEPETTPQFVYFIHRGQVRVYENGPDHSARLVEILGPGEWCGIAALAQVPRCGTRAVAVNASLISEVPAERLLDVLAKDPRASADLIQQLANKVRTAREDASRLVFDDCHNRLVKTLLRFSRSAAASPAEDGVVLRITHQQLAQAVGVARETVSLALTQLRLQKIVRTGRNQLIFDPEVLQRFEGSSNERVVEKVA
jgi:CRP-like cAMP-binding protein